MTREEISSCMSRLASNIDGPWELDYSLWGNMLCLDDYLSLAKEGIISWESYDSMFFSLLNNSTPTDSDNVANKGRRSTPSIFKKIKKLFSKANDR